MKVRFDFVTNSSSSSFIVAINSKYETFISALIACTDYDETSKGKRIATTKELDDFIVYLFGCSGDTVESILTKEEGLREMYNQMKTAIDTGKVIVHKRVGYDAIALTSLVSAMASSDTDNIEIIYNEE